MFSFPYPLYRCKKLWLPVSVSVMIFWYFQVSGPKRTGSSVTAESTNGTSVWQAEQVFSWTGMPFIDTWILYNVVLCGECIYWNVMFRVLLTISWFHKCCNCSLKLNLILPIYFIARLGLFQTQCNLIIVFV
jgi:hypothetical protein